jgi:hypothetical protein
MRNDFPGWYDSQHKLGVCGAINLKRWETAFKAVRNRALNESESMDNVL